MNKKIPYPAIFTGRGGHPGENELANRTFKVGETYSIIGGEIGQSSSSFEIKGFPGSWNSVMFDYGEELAPLTSPYTSIQEFRDKLTRKAFEEWMQNPSGNSATANLRNELCAVIAEREDLKAEVSKLRKAVAAHLDEFAWMDGPEGWRESVQTLRDVLHLNSELPTN